MNPVSTDISHSSDSAASIGTVKSTEESNDLVTSLHVINGQHYSGAERVQDLMGMSLQNYGYSVEFATLLEGKFEGNRRSTCPIHKTPMRGKLDFGVSRRLAKLANQQQASILHAHTPRSLMAAIGAKRLTGLPLVYHVHSPVGKDSTRWLQNKINLFIEKRSISYTDHLICVSDNVGTYMESLGIPSSKITVVPNGVPVIDQPPKLERAETPEKKWKFTLGTVALFRPRKGTEVLLESLAKLVEKGVDVGLLAVGGFETEEYENKLKQIVKQLGIQGRVHWTGFTREVLPLFGEMDLFVLPSLFGEGLPMVILEAMAMGVPVIASRVEGVEQVIRPTVDGDISEPGNCNDLALRIDQLLQLGDGLEGLGRNAKGRQKEHFSDQSMCQQTAAVYDKILKS